MDSIAYPEIYAKCLDITYREADRRVAGEDLYQTIVAAANQLYALIVEKR
jgi:hypothetical protein